MTEQANVNLAHCLGDLFPGTTEAKWGNVLREVFDESAFPFQDAYKGNGFEYAAAALLGMLKGRDLPVIGTQTKRVDIQNAAKIVPVAYDFSKITELGKAYTDRVLSSIFTLVQGGNPDQSQKPVILFTDDAPRVLSKLSVESCSGVKRINDTFKRPLVVQVPSKSDWYRWDPPAQDVNVISKVYAAALESEARRYGPRDPNRRTQEQTEFEFEGKPCKAVRTYHEGDRSTIQFYSADEVRPDLSFLHPETTEERNNQMWYLPHLIMASALRGSLSFCFRRVSKANREADKANEPRPIPYGYHSMFSGGVSPHMDSLAPYTMRGQSIRDSLLDEKGKKTADRAIVALRNVLDVDQCLRDLEGNHRGNLQNDHLQFLINQSLELIAVQYALSPRAKSMHVIGQAIDGLKQEP